MRRRSRDAAAAFASSPEASALSEFIHDFRRFAAARPRQAAAAARFRGAGGAGATVAAQGASRIRLPKRGAAAEEASMFLSSFKALMRDRGFPEATTGGQPKARSGD